MATASQSFWGAASRAVRLPSIKDLALNIYGELPPMGPIPMAVQFNGNPDFRSEALRAYEAGYRRQLSSRATLDVAAFVNDYSHLQNMLQQAPRMSRGTLVMPFTYANAMHGRSTGLETAVTWNPTRSWRLAASHAWLAGRFSYDPSQLGVPRGDDNQLQAPRNTFDARSWLDLGRRWALDTRLYYTSAMGTPDVPRHLRADIRLGYRIAELGEISVGVNDAFENRHVEFITTGDYLLNSYVQRSFYIKLSRSF
jgi:iron complex outermembrane receptor protein